MVLEGGKPHYIGKREAAITAWYGDDMETTTFQADGGLSSVIPGFMPGIHGTARSGAGG
jgi:hypothetical protein